MNENLNLIEILKDVPEGTKLYSPLFGDTTFIGINEKSELHPIKVSVTSDDGCLTYDYYTAEGKYLSSYTKTSECLLFPSKDQRDWSKFVPPLKEGTPVIVSHTGKEFFLRYYAFENKAYLRMDKEVIESDWSIIIPFDKFDPNNIEESLKYNIVK